MLVFINYWDTVCSLSGTHLFELGALLVWAL